MLFKHHLELPAIQAQGAKLAKIVMLISIQLQGCNIAIKFQRCNIYDKAMK